jgi:hypothetical protein
MIRNKQDPIPFRVCSIYSDVIEAYTRSKKELTERVPNPILIVTLMVSP